MKTPKPKLQIPKKFQNPNGKQRTLEVDGYWAHGFGGYEQSGKGQPLFSAASPEWASF